MTASSRIRVSTQGGPGDGAPAPSGLFPRVICPRLSGVPQAEQTDSISGLPPYRRLASSTRRLGVSGYNPSDVPAQPISCDGVPAIGGMNDAIFITCPVVGVHYRVRISSNSIRPVIPNSLSCSAGAIQ